MASSTEPAPSPPSALEEWKSSLGHLLIPTTAIKPATDKLDSSKGSYSQDSSIITISGAKCVSKTIHTFLFAKNEFRKQFIDGCLELSKIRHPNSVQLLGVQLQDDGTPPALIFEYFPLNLQSCLECYPSVPKHDKSCILYDVSKGLHYLHSRPLPIIHGSLNARNVLLTVSLQAKISDPIHFGAQVCDSACQPPEKTATISSDVFSYGDLIIHVLLQKPPSQLESKNSENENDDSSEVQRREKYISALGDSNQTLKEIAIKCLDNNPILRPTSASLVRNIEKLIEQPDFDNVLDMYHALEKLTLSKETIDSLTRTLQGKEVEIEALKQQMEPLRNDLTAKDECLQAQILEVDSYKQALQGKEARIRAHESGNRAKEALIKAKDREIAAKKQDVAAKESLLRSCQKRIGSLEHQVLSMRKGVDVPLSPSVSTTDPIPFSIRSVSGSSPKQLNPPEVVKADTQQVMFRKNKGRVGRNVGIFSDGFAYQDAVLRRANSMSAKDYDPVLANILARQHQRIEESEVIPEEKKEKSVPPPVRPKRPRASSLTSSELQHIMYRSSDS